MAVRTALMSAQLLVVISLVYMSICVVDVASAMEGAWAYGVMAAGCLTIYNVKKRGPGA